MARSGHWREAKFRWEQALKQSPADARLWNNLAVAEEALGAPEDARRHFEKALSLDGTDARIEDNAVRSALFWRRSKDPADADSPVPAVTHEGRAKKGRDTVEVRVELPIPPRLKLDGMKTLLVASFLVNDSDMLDVNREMVRFLRSEFRKHTDLDVLDVTPAPAVPEQTLDEMAKNAEFWRHMGRDYGADVIVSGEMHYTRRDASGFKTYDVVSDTTGQRVRQTQFVEQEEFSFELDVIYLRGSDGSLLFRDRMRRQAVFRGKSNDPISAFYVLGSTIAGDVLSAVTTQNRPDTRFLFKG